jgi:hypothetical protein
MVGQYNPSMNFKWIAMFNALNSIAQQIDMPRQQIIVCTLKQINREEIRTARTPNSSILHNPNPFEQTTA